MAPPGWLLTGLSLFARRCVGGAIRSQYWRERYALGNGDRELAILDGKGCGRRPGKITVNDEEGVESGLLLFAAFVVRGSRRVRRARLEPAEQRR